MKKILLFSLILCSFVAKAQNPLVGKPSLKLVFDVAQTKKWDFTVDTNNMLEINGTGGTPSIRLTDFSGTGNRILAVDADGDLVRTTVDPALTTVAGSNTQVQYNNSGSFGASSDFIFNGTNLGVNGIFPVSTSSGLALRNNAGTAIANIGVGSTSSTNSTWTGNNVITGDWDITGSLDVDNINVNGNTISSTDSNGNITLSPNGNGDVVSGNASATLGNTSIPWNEMYSTRYRNYSSGTSYQDLQLGSLNRVGGGSTGTLGIFYTLDDNADDTGTTPGVSFTARRSAGTALTTRPPFAFYNGTAGLIASFDATNSLNLYKTTNQIITGTGSNLTTLNFPASSGAVTVTMPNETGTVVTQSYATFTPELADASTGGNLATGTFSGEVLKTGRQVVINMTFIDINTTGMTGANDIFIRNLQYTNGSINANGSIDANNLTFVGFLSPRVAASDTFLRIGEVVSGAVVDNVIVSEISSGVTDLRISVTYITN